MRQLSRAEVKALTNYVDGVVQGCGIGIENYSICERFPENPFVFFFAIAPTTDEKLVVRACNKLFHDLELLPRGKNLALGVVSEYCMFTQEECENPAGFEYLVYFNHPIVKEFGDDDSEFQFTFGRWLLKRWTENCDGDEDDGNGAGGDYDAEIQELVAGIKEGRLKSKTPDGYLVLRGEFYDLIESGRKRTEYRDFTEYNIKRTIGLKTVRFNRGYVKNAPQMKWEVEKVMLTDGGDLECDPFDVPKGFVPATIAIHLGKRLG